MSTEILFLLPELSGWYIHQLLSFSFFTLAGSNADYRLIEQSGTSKKTVQMALGVLLNLHLWYLYMVSAGSKFKINKFDMDW
ncbi:MAG TPA: hypothetical protein VJ111_08185 [Chitinophagaceae bacterium]|nr:hypothetical protein [Chitinophagaceae bacterium]